MILNKDVSDYDTLFKQFCNSFTFAVKTVGKFEYPPLDKLPADKKLTQAGFIQKLVHDNPKKFLFG
jgi:hypothetical protein